MSRAGRTAVGVAVVLVAAAVAYALWPARVGGERSGVEATLAVSAALGPGDASGFARALAPRVFSFPADLGPHPDFRTEWWYYTGNLESAAGRHFGFQLTFFRTALAPPAQGADEVLTPAQAARHAGEKATVDASA